MAVLSLPPAPVRPAPVRPAAGKHRRSALRTGAGQAVEVAARLGTMVTLASLVVVGGSLGGLFEGVPMPADVSSTFDGP